MKEREVDGIRISKEGWLEIQRGVDSFKNQLCPFCVIGKETARCGDWCPHFGAPEYQNHRIFLSLCAGTTLCTHEDDFEDLREK